MPVDISNELNTIKSTQIGRTMRPALHDAIHKQNKELNRSSALIDEFIKNAQQAAPQNAEIVAARIDNNSNMPVAYDTLGERLDKMKEDNENKVAILNKNLEQTNAQLSHVEYTNKEIIKSLNLFDENNVTNGVKIWGFTSEAKPNYVSDDTWFVSEKITLEKYYKKLRIKMPSVANDEYSALFFVDQNDNYVLFRNYTQISVGDFVVQPISSKSFLLDVDSLLTHYPNIKYMYLSEKINEKHNHYVKLEEYSYITHQDIIDVDSNLDIVIPKVIPVVIGHEMNIYYENILLNGRANRVGKMSCEGYAGQSSSYIDEIRYTPSSVLEYNPKISIFLNDTKKIDMYKSINVKFIPSDTGDNTLKVLYIGDSRTNQGYITQGLLNNFDSDNMNIELLGTRGNGLNKHEGRPGYGVKHYCRNAEYNGTTNPFYNDGFDFSHYMRVQNYTDVDYVVINLGINDISELNVVEYMSYLSSMVDSIHRYRSDIKIIIAPSESFCDTTFFEWDQNMNHKTEILTFTKGIIDEYDEGKVPNVYVAPTYANVDLVNDFPTEEVSLSKHNTSIKVKRVTDVLHADVCGNYKVADVVYFMIKYITYYGM